MTRHRASLAAAAEILGWIVTDTIQAVIDFFVLLRLLRAPAKPAPAIMRPVEPRLPRAQNF